MIRKKKYNFNASINNIITVGSKWTFYDIVGVLRLIFGTKYKCQGKFLNIDKIINIEFVIVLDNFQEVNGEYDHTRMYVF